MLKLLPMRAHINCVNIGCIVKQRTSFSTICKSYTGKKLPADQDNNEKRTCKQKQWSIVSNAASQYGT